MGITPIDTVLLIKIINWKRECSLFQFFEPNAPSSWITDKNNQLFHYKFPKQVCLGSHLLIKAFLPLD